MKISKKKKALQLNDKGLVIFLAPWVALPERAFAG
jgi:hypothetical protein